jgi:selenocysteine lyase/cysteine desulfurase
LNSGSFGPMALPVFEQYSAAMREWETLAYAAFGKFLRYREEARCKVADLLGADPEEIALTRNATEGINFVMRGMTFQPGDEIVISDQENPALSFPAFYLGQQGGVKVRVFAVDADPEVTLLNLKRALTPRTRLIAITYVSCENGTRLPVREICRLAAARGIHSLVDAAQAVGQFPVDVRTLGCDFLTMCCHKWLFGPKGTGAFYIRKRLLDELPPTYVGMGSMQEMELPPSRVVTLRPAALRFEYGSRNFAAHAGVIASIEWLELLGWHAIYAQMQNLSSYLKHELTKIPGVQLQTPFEWERSSSLVNFSVGGADPEQLAAELWEQHEIVCRAATGPPGVRISLAYFNTREEVNCLLDVVDKVRQQ